MSYSWTIRTGLIAITERSRITLEMLFCAFKVVCFVVICDYMRAPYLRGLTKYKITLKSTLNRMHILCDAVGCMPPECEPAHHDVERARVDAAVRLRNCPVDHLTRGQRITIHHAAWCDMAGIEPTIPPSHASWLEIVVAAGGGRVYVVKLQRHLSSRGCMRKCIPGSLCFGTYQAA